MASNHLRCSLIKCLLSFLSCVAANAADLNSLEYHTRIVSYQPQLQEFPNDRLHRAYYVIQRFKNTITCDPKNITATWAGHDICGDTTYRGFYCTVLQGQADELTVAAVVFDGFGLCAPKLQGFVDQLPDVALFQASSNIFGGEIPRLNGLQYQYNLTVSEDVQAPLPYDEAKYSMIAATLNLGNIVIKVKLMASRSGSRKREKGSSGSTSAQALLLNNNNLSGPLPASLSLSKLSYLALANNKLTGRIPPSIGNLQDSLLELLLLNNQFSGCLPHELGMLHKATVIDAGMNQLTGPIPSSFSCLSSVEQLNLASNSLYGQVPDALCKLAGPAGRLANLTLSGNYFTSVGPACSSLIKDGVMDVKNNCIPGLANQRRPAECAAFQSEPKKTCPAATTQVTCPAAAPMGALAPGERKAAREYSSYVTYATLHE